MDHIINDDCQAAIDHTHDISGVNGLREALDHKSDVNHRHAIENVDGLSRELNDRPLIGHTHTVGEVKTLEVRAIHPVLSLSHR